LIRNRSTYSARSAALRPPATASAISGATRIRIAAVISITRTAAVRTVRPNPFAARSFS
jgi:hypothetical protein